MSAAKDFPRTYFAQDRQGYFYETLMGERSFEEVVGCILSGEYESCAQVYVVDEGVWKVWSHRVADEVLLRWKRTDLSFTPKFLVLHHRDAVTATKAERQSPAEKAFDRAENAAERVGEAQRAAA